MRRTTTVLWALAGAVVLQACESAVSREPTGVSAVAGPPRAVLGCQTTTHSITDNGSQPYFGSGAPCGTVTDIYVYSTDASYQSFAGSVGAGAAVWIDSLNNNGGNLPTYGNVIWNGTQFPSGQFYAQLVPPTGTGTTRYWCGNSSTGGITLVAQWSKTGTSKCNADDAFVTDVDLWKLAMHELGHGLGFKHIPATNPGVLADGGCIMAIPSTSIYASGPCDVEMQMIYYVYGLRGNSEASTFSVLHRPTLTVTPSNQSINLGTPWTFTYNLQSAGSPPPGVCWAVSPSNLLQLSSGTCASSQVAYGAALGSGTLSAQVQVDSLTIAPVVWSGSTGTSSVTVVQGPPPPPPSALVVTGISGTAATLNWTSGSQYATTVVQDRLTGTSTWTTAGTATVGATSFGLTGLSQCAAYDVQLSHVLGGQSSTNYTVTNAFTSGGTCPPSGLSVTNITTTGASLAWADGTAGELVTVQTANNGGTLTTVASGLSGTSYPLSGLSACTLYDVNLYGTANGQQSANYFTPGAFSTPAATGGVCAPYNFVTVYPCTHTTINGKDYTNVPVSWIRGDFNAALYEIGSSTTSNSNTATVLTSGPASTTSVTTGPFPSYPGAPPTYLWVRHRLSKLGAFSAWTANVENPVVIGGGC